jgi:hypothetical protein
MTIIVSSITTVSEIDICNLALSKLGDEANITSFTDGSVQAKYCARFYPIARAVLLDKHVWNFATKEAALVVTTNTTTAWDYAYLIPADFMGIIDVREASYRDYIQAPATQNYSMQSGIIYSNIVDAVLLYSSTDAISTALFQPLFIEALATLLASYLAGPIIKGDVGVSAAQKLLATFSVALEAAIESDTAYRKITPKYIPAGISARA